MGYPLQLNAPSFTVAGDLYAIGAFVWPSALGITFYEVGIYKKVGGDWNQAFKIAEYNGDAELAAAIKLHGDRVGFITWLTEQIKQAFVALFGTVSDTDASAITAAINKLQVVVVNNQPTIK